MEIDDSRPALFEQSPHCIWTDAYIQRQLLKVHLDPSSDGASRRRESVAAIVSFICNRTREGSRLLDLGCGPGLYTSLLADAHYEVTGIDFNRASIEYAAAQRADIRYYEGDYLLHYPPGEFDAVTMIYCDMGTHPDEARDRLLANIYRSLADGGVFIFDVFSEKIVGEKQEGRSWDYEPSGGFWSGGEYLLLSQTFHYPENRAFAYRYHLVLPEMVKSFLIWERYYSEEEITGVLEKAGFRNVSIRTDLLGRNNFTSSGEMFVIAEK